MSVSNFMWVVFYVVVFLPQIISHILSNKEIGSWACNLNARHQGRGRNCLLQGQGGSSSRLRGASRSLSRAEGGGAGGPHAKADLGRQTFTLHAHWLTVQWASAECSTLPGTVLITGDEAVTQKDQEEKTFGVCLLWLSLASLWRDRHCSRCWVCCWEPSQVCTLAEHTSPWPCRGTLLGVRNHIVATRRW